MVEGIALGFVSWLSLLLSWAYLPTRLQNLLKRYPLLADVGSGAVIYLLLSSVSKSLVAVFGAAVAGLLMSITIRAQKAYEGMSK